MIFNINHSDKIDQMTLESPSRIEPATLDTLPVEIADLISEISARASVLGSSLHPRTAASLAGIVRMMNTYYSNLIEGHNTRPRDIERALRNDLSEEPERRNLQMEARAHHAVQARVDEIALNGSLPDPASSEFIRGLHEQFYQGAPEDFRVLADDHRRIAFVAGEWRSRPEHDVAVGRHMPPSSHRVADFMTYFSKRYAFAKMGKAARITAMACAHHRLNYIHPFIDGNGRVSRLMSHAMGHAAGIGSHGLWSVSRGLARGLDPGPEGRNEYRDMMDRADMPRQGDRDGRGNLSERALESFVIWFLSTCLDQIRFMTDLFDLNQLERRLHRLVDSDDTLRAEARALLTEAMVRGSFERGAASRLTGLSESTARRLLRELVNRGLLSSETPKGAVFLSFPAETFEILFPRLFPPS